VVASETVRAMRFSLSDWRELLSMSAAEASRVRAVSKAPSESCCSACCLNRVTSGSSEASVRISARTLTKASAASLSLRSRSAGVSAATSFSISAP
jgi:hypothetical protein